MKLEPLRRRLGLAVKIKCYNLDCKMRLVERDAQHTVGFSGHNNTRTLRDSVYVRIFYLHVVLSSSAFFFVFWLVSSLDVPFIVVILLHADKLLNSTIIFLLVVLVVSV